MWNVLVFASWLGSGSLAFDVLLSGVMGSVGLSAWPTLEMGSRAVVSETEAKLREKTAGRKAGCASAGLRRRPRAGGGEGRRQRTSARRSQTGQRTCASHCGCVEWRAGEVSSVVSRQSAVLIEDITPEVKWRPWPMSRHFVSARASGQIGCNGRPATIACVVNVNTRLVHLTCVDADYFAHRH
jgi:hypothetical protein